MRNTLSCFQRIISLYFIGNDSKEDTPVPIPNTEVKLFNAEDSVSENRKLLIFFCVFLLFIIHFIYVNFIFDLHCQPIKFDKKYHFKKD